MGVVQSLFLRLYVHLHELVQNLHVMLPGHVTGLQSVGVLGHVVWQEPESPPIHHLHRHQVDPPGWCHHHHAGDAEDGFPGLRGGGASGDGEYCSFKAPLPAEPDDDTHLLHEDADHLLNPVVMGAAVVELVQNPDRTEAAHRQSKSQGHRQHRLILPHQSTEGNDPPRTEDDAPGRGHREECSPGVGDPRPVDASFAALGLLLGVCGLLQVLPRLDRGLLGENRLTVGGATT
mmetsp:Transcript_89761/g.205181  ORF Transcript_89761/g.205181 Transcript_89761/m.205181 type:complete len:233 (+) Transcript_89761:539-1237(+)